MKAKLSKYVKTDDDQKYIAILKQYEKVYIKYILSKKVRFINCDIAKVQYSTKLYVVTESGSQTIII